MIKEHGKPIGSVLKLLAYIGFETVFNMNSNFGLLLGAGANILTRHNYELVIG